MPRYWVSITYFTQKSLSLKRIIDTMEKEVNGRLDTVAATRQKVRLILEIAFNFCTISNNCDLLLNV